MGTRKRLNREAVRLGLASPWKDRLQVDTVLRLAQDFGGELVAEVLAENSEASKDAGGE